MRRATPQETSRPTRQRGVQRLWDPRVWGTTIGAAGGTVFVMVNRAELGDPWTTVAALVWLVAFAAYLWFVLVAPRWFEAPAPIGRYAGLVYVGSVVGMLVLIRLGSALLDEAGRGELRPALIVVAVGLHFLPFAAAFATPMFTRLGAVMAGIGAVGLGVGWVYADAAASAAVVAGIVMIAVITADAFGSAERDEVEEGMTRRG